MSNFPTAADEYFPKRKCSVTGKWSPIYLELRAGSGERVCIGVVSESSRGTKVLPVGNLVKLECAYGVVARSLMWAAELALIEIEERVLQVGFDAGLSTPFGIEGLHLGEARIGAGESATDLMELALSQVSSLYGASTFSLIEEGMPARYMAEATEPLVTKIRRQVVASRPEQKQRFGVSFRPSQASRPIKFGYVGKLLAANFASLDAQAPRTVTGQVDRAKARLWDLQQLETGVLSDSPLGLPSTLRRELLVFRPRGGKSVVSGDLSFEMKRAISEAEEELEAEADKFDIQFRPLRSADLIAKHILQVEQAA